MKKILIVSLLSILPGFLGCAKSIPDEEWTVAVGEDKGKTMIVRFRTNIPSSVDDIKQYPYLMPISWRYEAGNGNGMPSKAEEGQMKLFEDLLKSLETRRIAFLTASVTCDGVKEWQWYTRNKDEFMAALNSALRGQPSFPIQVAQQQDPEWSAYFRFKNNVK